MKPLLRVPALLSLSLLFTLSAACGGESATGTPAPVASASPVVQAVESTTPSPEPVESVVPSADPLPSATPSATPSPSAQPASGTALADWSWFDDAVFVGDSVSLKLTGYVTKMRQSESDYLGKAQFLTAGSLGSGNALWDVSDQSVHPLYQGTKMRLEDSVAACGAKKLYILLGMNDIGMYGVEDSIKNMETLLGLITEKSPGLQVFVQSATPIHKGNEKKVLNNANLVLYNQGLEEMCQRNGYAYVNIASVLTDAEGYLPDEYCSDISGMGMHFTDAACEIWVNYLRQDAAARLAGA